MQRPIMAIAVAILLLCVLGSFPSAAGDKKGNKVLIVTVDGFRWDYFSQFNVGELSGFDRLRSEGASAKRLLPEFPTLSFVNYYSLITGLHPESHGMIDNYMWDENHDEVFLLGENQDQYHPFWWNDGEPLWITAKKQGKRSYFWYWCGCEIEIRGYRPDFCQEYLSSPNPSLTNFTDALNAAVEVLRNGSADLAGVYLEQIDDTGHGFGPDSNEIRDKILRIDAELNRVQDLLENTRFEGQITGSMFDSVNMVVFSDHGMVERVGGASDNSAAVIHLLDIVDTTDYVRVMGSKAGPILSIWPNPGQEDWLYERLKSANRKMSVYKKADIPDKYFLKNHYRVPPIYLVADKGYVFLTNPAVRTLNNVGYHGYDNAIEDTHAIFFARGPEFKKGAVVETLPNIDIYGLLSNVLGIEAAPNNGTLEHTCGLVSDVETCTTS